MNLCASAKRMRMHWADVHGRTANNFDFMATLVKMQTFFRGTKIRYFEVCESSGMQSRKMNQPIGTVPKGLDSAVRMMEQHGAVEDEVSSGQSEGLASNSDDSDDTLSDLDQKGDDGEDEHAENTDGRVLDPVDAPRTLDLETLRIFHHFLSSASRSLPEPHYRTSEQCYWQKAILPLAFSRHWLMSGLLAISVRNILSHDE